MSLAAVSATLPAMNRRPKPLVDPWALWQLMHIGDAALKSPGFCWAAFTFVTFPWRLPVLVCPPELAQPRYTPEVGCRVNASKPVPPATSPPPTPAPVAPSPTAPADGAPWKFGWQRAQR